jgi:hypothetical protein
VSRASADGAASAGAVAPRRRAIAWVDLECLLCGELVATLEDNRVVHPRTSDSIRLAGRLILCGRCGGVIVPGHLTKRVSGDPSELDRAHLFEDFEPRRGRPRRDAPV